MSEKNKKKKKGKREKKIENPNYKNFPRNQNENFPKIVKISVS